MRFEIPGPLPLLVVATAAVAACSGGSTSPAGMGRVAFQIATTATSSSNGPAAADVVVSKGSNTVVVSQVQLVARKIRFRRVDASCAEDPDQDRDEAENEAEEEECPVLKLGPLLLDPPLTAGAVTVFTADVPVGTYSRIRLQIHKPRGDRDQAFLAANPTFSNVSIRVKGTFNGAPFTFDTAIEEEEEIALSPPIVVTSDGTTAFTLFLDVRGWFLDQSGNALVDPTSPTSDIRRRIEQNIRTSFRAFRDEDRDGNEDD